MGLGEDCRNRVTRSKPAIESDIDVTKNRAARSQLIWGEEKAELPDSVRDDAEPIFGFSTRIGLHCTLLTLCFQ